MDWWSTPLEAFGGATGYDMAVKGFSFHISQHNTGFRVPLRDDWRFWGRRFGLAYTTVGPDVIGGDFFENIVRTPMDD